jgi:SAM-dependent methyltransferase
MMRHETPSGADAPEPTGATSGLEAGEYNEEFFRALREGALRSAGQIVPLMLELIQPRSVIDVGCGTGTWLATFARYGVADYLGVDAFTPTGLLEIPRDRFVEADLTQPLVLGRSFDLAISLETAEHLPEVAAERFVESLTRLAPVVMFSAAIPGQGGTGHLNEQWPGYWSRIFADRGFEPADVLRPRIWDNEQVEVWYAQNTILYVENSRRAEFRRLFQGDAVGGAPLAMVHPKLFWQRLLRLHEMVQAHGEASAQAERLNEALAAERQKASSFSEEIERLLQVAAEHDARAGQYHCETAKYRAQVVEALSRAETSRLEAERYRAEVQRLEEENVRGRLEVESQRAEVSRYRFMSEPGNMSLLAYLRALPEVVSGVLRRTMRRDVPDRRSSGLGPWR